MLSVSPAGVRSGFVLCMRAQFVLRKNNANFVWTSRAEQRGQPRWYDRLNETTKSPQCFFFPSHKRLHEWMSVVVFRSLPLHIIPCNSLCGGRWVITRCVTAAGETWEEEEAKKFLVTVTVSEMLRSESLFFWIAPSLWSAHYFYTLLFYMCIFFVCENIFCVVCDHLWAT